MTIAGQIFTVNQDAAGGPVVRAKKSDFDGDGRSELSFPVAFASNICVYKPVDNGTCPGGDGTGLACQERWACPEDPLTGLPIPGGAGTGVSVDLDNNGVPETEINQLAIGSHQYGFPD